MDVSSGGAWSRQRVAALVGQSEVFVLDSSAELLAVPEWLLGLGGIEVSEPVSQRMSMVHPEDRSIAAEMFLAALANPGDVIDGTYRMEIEGRWFVRSRSMLSLLGTDILDGVVVYGSTDQALGDVGDDKSPSNFHGDYQPSDWCVQVLDARARILEVDGMAEKIFGRTAEAMVGESATQLVAPENLTSATRMWSDLMARPGNTAAARQRVLRPDGTTLWTDSFFVSRPQPDGSMRVLKIVHDVTEQRNQEVAIEQLAQEFRSLAEEVPAAIFRCDRSGTISFRNQMWATVLPVDRPVTFLQDLIHPANRAQLDDELERLASLDEEDRSSRLELRGFAGDAMLALKLRAVGHPGSEHVSFVGSVEDVTSTVTLRRRATHDALTGLLNRDSIEDQLTAALEEDAEAVIVAFLDLDGFKYVNDTYGHDVGDVVLATLARRLRRGFRSDDLIGRYGGDEFVLVCRARTGIDEQNIVGAAERVFQEPIVWGDGQWQPRGSVGTARSMGQEDAASLIRRADRSMYVMKRLHRRQAAS